MEEAARRAKRAKRRTKYLDTQVYRRTAGTPSADGLRVGPMALGFATRSSNLDMASLERVVYALGGQRDRSPPKTCKERRKRDEDQEKHGCGSLRIGGRCLFCWRKAGASSGAALSAGAERPAHGSRLHTIRPSARL